MNAATQPVRMTVGSSELTLHPLDYHDVALTPAGAGLVRKAACTVLGKRMPSVDLETFPLREVLALFMDQVYWEEESGRLFMCADFPDLCYCLPIPPEYWRIMTRGRSVH